MKLKIIGTTTNFQQIGTGLPVVLLHGWGCDWQIWSPVISELSEQYQLIIPDLPVLGQSKLPADQVWDSHQYATWLHEFLAEVIPNQPFVLVGHSFGGKIAAIYAAEHATSLLKGTVIVDASGLPEKLTTSEELTQLVTKLVPGPLKKMLGTGFKKSILNRLNIATDYQEASEIQQAVLRKIVREDISHQLAQIDTPSLVIWGKLDTTTPLEKGELFAELIADASLVIFEQSGHYPFVDETPLFISTLKAFITKNT